MLSQRNKGGQVGLEAQAHPVGKLYVLVVWLARGQLKGLRQVAVGKIGNLMRLICFNRLCFC